MRRLLARLVLYLRLLGIDMHRLRASIANFPRFVRDLRTYQHSEPEASFAVRLNELRPMLHDFEQVAGEARGHYFHQDLWAARKIFEARPVEHLDIGSRIDGFVAHLLCFMPVRVVDIRPLKSSVEGLTFVRSDAQALTDLASDSVPSLSSLHAVEHFGLGRYGDPIDPRGHCSAMAAMARVLRKGGRLYFGIPIGRERLEFNAHRIMDPRSVIDSFPGLELVSFSVVDDDGNFHADVLMDRFRSARFACGLFEFMKPL